MMNQVKRTQTIRALFRLRDVTPIFKNKGSCLELDNDRGVFNGTVLNSIFQKLIYKNIYDTVDQNLTDSNVGARKGRNIRNHCFIVNSVIQSENANKSKSQGINLLIGDFKKCFDAMSLPIAMNDMFNAGVTDDNLNLLYNSNEQSDISVKTPFGKTERVPVKKTVCQGDVNAPFTCTTVGTLTYYISIILGITKRGMAYPAKDFLEIVRVWESLFLEFHKNEPDQLSRKFNVVKDLAALLKQRYPDEQFESIINKFALSRTCFRMTAVAKKFAAERAETLKTSILRTI